MREYDSEGKVVWEYNTGTKLYGAVRLHDGNTLIGTGGGHSVLEVNRPGEVVWIIDQNDLPGIRLEWVTNVGQLPNGNIVFGNCHAGPSNPQIIEVTRSKKVIWAFNDFKAFGNALPVSMILGVQDGYTR